MGLWYSKDIGDKLVWSSKKQKSTSISSTEAEYIALSGCCAQILWIHSQLTDYGLSIHEDYSVSAEQTKRDGGRHGIYGTLLCVGRNIINADIFTKPLPREIQFLDQKKLGMRSMSPETLKRLTEEENDGRKGIMCDIRELSRLLVVAIYSITHVLLDAACKKALNLLKKGLLIREGKLRQLPKGDYRDGLQIADMDRMTLSFLV
ncbi:hypothetical protein Tco_1507765 [Tanacetum coccineum]